MSAAREPPNDWFKINIKIKGIIGIFLSMKIYKINKVEIWCQNIFGFHINNTFLLELGYS